jgi:hypothetical protein
MIPMRGLTEEQTAAGRFLPSGVVGFRERVSVSDEEWAEHRWAHPALSVATSDGRRGGRGEIAGAMGTAEEGLHEENGRITIEEHIRHAISHDLIHLRQIAESLVPAGRSL